MRRPCLRAAPSVLRLGSRSCSRRPGRDGGSRGRRRADHAGDRRQAQADLADPGRGARASDSRARLSNADTTRPPADPLPPPPQLGLQSVAESEISKVQSTFEYYDADGNGCMDGPEFAKMAAELVRARRMALNSGPTPARRRAASGRPRTALTPPAPARSRRPTARTATSRAARPSARSTPTSPAPSSWRSCCSGGSRTASRRATRRPGRSSTRASCR